MQRPGHLDPLEQLVRPLSKGLPIAVEPDLVPDLHVFHGHEWIVTERLGPVKHLLSGPDFPDPIASRHNLPADGGMFRVSADGTFGKVHDPQAGQCLAAWTDPSNKGTPRHLPISPKGA